MAILQGAPNFRDLGGCLTPSGQAIRRGRVFRSQRLAGLSQGDRLWLDQSGIVTVCDLRTPTDLARRPNEWPDGRLLRTIVLETDRGAEAATPQYWRNRLDDPAFGPAQARDEMLALYRLLPRLFARHMAELFAYLADEGSGPLLIHCEAGKDRTGFVCAVLLLSLGVSKEVVLADYLQSAERYVLTPDSHIAQQLLSGDTPERAMAALKEVMTVYPAYLDAALAEIDAAHGSLDAYLRHAAGISRDRLMRVHRHLVAD
ncbi:tyrosine-protein phosphatase [Hydrogenophaga sp.]|jgi:protein-tyrosine phosphatase|uniref:tyrosine-protein phosphatase n=1 Tax=Hydrogenophaga sp. TaxID=1904254 RepID=UPI003F6F9F66